MNLDEAKILYNEAKGNTVSFDLDIDASGRWKTEKLASLNRFIIKYLPLHHSDNNYTLVCTPHLFDIIGNFNDVPFGLSIAVELRPRGIKCAAHESEGYLLQEACYRLEYSVVGTKNIVCQPFVNDTDMLLIYPEGKDPVCLEIKHVQERFYD